MTIRITCSGCGSLLKIKDELAGTEGKCPKCKTEFEVPSPEAEDESPGIELDVPKSVETPKRKVEPKEEPRKKEESKTEIKTETNDESEAEETLSLTDEVPSSAVETKVAAARMEAGEAKSKPDKPAKPAVKAKKPSKSADDEFDPAEFLMEGGDGSEAVRHKSTIPMSTEEDSQAWATAEDPRSKKAGGKSSAHITTATSAASARQDLSGSASSHAKEMMMKAMEESRAHASEMPAEQERPGFDYAGLFQEFGLKGGAGLLIIVVVAYGMYLVVDQIYGGGLKLPKLGYVYGTVTLDGKPLPNATVFFEPKEASLADSKRERPRTSTGVTDDKGFYRMYYIDRTQGVAVGKCRYWLSCITDKGQVIPPQYTEGVLQLKEVKAGKEEFNISMTTAAPDAKP